MGWMRVEPQQRDAHPSEEEQSGSMNPRDFSRGENQLRALRESMLASTIMGVVLVAMQARFGLAAYNALLYIPTGLAIFLGAMRLQGAFKRRDMNILLEVLPSRLRWISKLVSWMVT
jgi:hypothetical protein